MPGSRTPTKRPRENFTARSNSNTVRLRMARARTTASTRRARTLPNHAKPMESLECREETSCLKGPRSSRGGLNPQSETTAALPPAPQDRTEFGSRTQLARGEGNTQERHEYVESPASG